MEQNKSTLVLTPDQTKALDDLRDRIKDELETEVEKNWCSDRTMCRYLRARDWDVDKAHKMLSNSIKWRKEYKPHLIKPEDVLSELNNEGKLYLFGKDKQGRPLIYMRPGRDNTGSDEKVTKLKYLVYLMEKAAEYMDEDAGIEKLVWVVDFKGYSQISGMAMTGMSVEVLHVLQDHYPERLGGAFLFHTPWVWGMFWKMLTPFMNEVTKSKVKMFGKDIQQLSEHIDHEHLLAEYGGTSDFVYSSDGYRKFLEDKFHSENKEN